VYSRLWDSAVNFANVTGEVKVSISIPVNPSHWRQDGCSLAPPIDHGLSVCQLAGPVDQDSATILRCCVNKSQPDQASYIWARLVHQRLSSAIDGCSSVTTNVSTPELSGREELARYKALKVPAGHSSSLAFWRESSKDYPLLSEVARRVLWLCISASSAQSERDFSSVGRTITDARSSLSARKVEEMELIRWGCRASIINFAN
jgi:hypothetical protein